MGHGYLTNSIRQANPRATLLALDLEFSLCGRRRRVGRQPGLVPRLAGRSHAAGGSYDIILSNSVFQWFTRPGETLRDYHRCLRRAVASPFRWGPAPLRELVASFRGTARALSMTASPEVAAVSFPGKKSGKRWW